MPVETIGASDGVAKLDESWPNGTEPVKQGDDHIRNIKKAVKNQERINSESNFRAINSNMLINADFSLWRRGSSFTGFNYGADRWMGFNTNVDEVWSPSEGPILRANRTDADDEPWIAQPVELRKDLIVTSVKPFRLGGTYTLSARVSTTNKLKPFLFYGSDGKTATGAITDDVFTYQEPDADGMVSFTFTVDNLPADGDVCALVGFKGETKGLSIDFFEAKLEVGGVATQFVPDDPADNLAKCQRFYQKGLQVVACALTDVTSARGVRSGILRFTTSMRVAPTVTPVYNSGWFSVTVSKIDTEQFRVQGTADTAVSGTWIESWTASAEF